MFFSQFRAYVLPIRYTDVLRLPNTNSPPGKEMDNDRISLVCLQNDLNLSCWTLRSCVSIYHRRQLSENRCELISIQTNRFYGHNVTSNVRRRSERVQSIKENYWQSEKCLNLKTLYTWLFAGRYYKCKGQCLAQTTLNSGILPQVKNMPTDHGKWMLKGLNWKRSEPTYLCTYCFNT